MACADSNTGGVDPRVAVLKATLSELPFVAGDLPGIGGVIKAEPDHFQVEELLPYAACGEGEHVYITLQRKGWNTTDVGEALARHFSIKSHDVGWGGRKDKQAVCTQTFSLHLPAVSSLDEIRSTLDKLPFHILHVDRHRNKIKAGHVAANRFNILLSAVSPEAINHARAIAQTIAQRRLPNFYGPQRFGHSMGNLERAMILLTRPKGGRRGGGKFLVSVLQSALFNHWLAQRMIDGRFNTILKGDVVKKTDTGGLFVVEEISEAAKRFDKGGIVYTGPMFGYKMMAAAEEAGRYESRILEDFNLTSADFKNLRAPGSRRVGLINIPDLVIHPADNGLEFSFTLPSGAYATTLMREFTRSNPDQTLP